MAGLVEYRLEDKTAFITLNRPEKLNAFNTALTHDFNDALARFDLDDNAWIAIVTGHGRAFSSGADVQDRFIKPQESARRQPAPIKGHGLKGFLDDMVNWKPVIGAAHGYAIGLALGLLLECDLSIAADDTKLQVAETPRGLWGSLYWRRIALRAGSTFADDVVLTGRFFTGEEATKAGAITRSVSADGLLREATSLAQDVLENPPLAVRSSVRARRWWLSSAERDWPLLKESFPLHLTDDFQESARAFAEKRAPNPYTGR